MMVKFRRQEPGFCLSSWKQVRLGQLQTETMGRSGLLGLGEVMVIFFAVAGNSYLVIRSLIVFFLAEVGLPNNNCVAFVGRFNNKVFAFFCTF